MAAMQSVKRPKLYFLYVWLLVLVSLLAPSSLLADDEPSLTRETNEAISPYWSPLLLPVSILAPGSAHWIRGDNETAKKIGKIAGASFLGFASVGAIAAFTGASAPLMIPAVPLLLVSGSTFIASGSADFIGSISNSNSLLSAEVPSLVSHRQQWSIELGYLHVPNRIFASQDYYQIGTGGALKDHLISFNFTSDKPVRNLFYKGELGLRIFSWGTTTQKNPIYFAFGLLHEQNPDSLYDATRFETSLISHIALSELSPTLSRAFIELSVGYQYLWTHYADFLNAPGDFQSAVSGGLDLGWQITDRFHANWGYQHSREGLIGGVFMGYLGHFHLGGGLRLTDSSWVNAKVLIGSPLSYFIGWETTL